MSNVTNETKGAANGNGAALAKREAKPPSRIEMLTKSFAQWRPTLAAILPKHIDPDRVIKICCNVYLSKPELGECTPTSMVRATLQCAELGLEPSPLLGECAFIPFDNTKKVKDGNTFRDVKVREVQLMPMYVGLIKLAKQTGEISDVYAVVVDESEKVAEFDKDGRFIGGFYVEEGTIRRIHHIRRMEGRADKLFAVYGVVKFKDGTCHYEVMSRSDVDKIRTRSKAKDSGPWVTDYEAMAKKTAIKQALKTVPKSPEKPALPQAIAADLAADLGEAFNTEVTASIDAEYTTEDEVQSTPAQMGPKSHADKLSDILGAKEPQTAAAKVTHDADGVVKS